MMKRVLVGCLSVFAIAISARGNDYPFQPAEMKDVSITQGFWFPRIETNRIVTVWSDFKKSEETGRIANFINAGKHLWGKFRGIPYDDSDVYKIIEGAAYTLVAHPDPKLDHYLDNLIANIASAQERDGYLYTARTLGAKRRMMGPVRWSNLRSSHELYNVGHLYEAATAHYTATGKRALLDVAIKNADLIERTFGLGQNQLRDVPGHEEIEIGLCKLYRVTQDTRYLKLAKTFIDLRGRKDLRPISELYSQDHLPVLEQKEAVGHAVRAGYLYTGMADVAALTGDKSYIDAIGVLWENVVSKKLHLNGGIGAIPRGERFGKNYQLPNETAYLETCASIANAFWNQRMFLLHGDSKYIDVLERIIYNGFLSGISMKGDEFFYPNPLASKGGYKRSKWFNTSCCPVNIVRFIPQIGTYTYAHRDDLLFWNLFIASDASVKLSSGKVALNQKTDYPWKGESILTVKPEKENQLFTLKVRIPGWAIGRPVPSDLYTQVQPGSMKDVSVLLNGKKIDCTTDKGYCSIRRPWKTGDRVQIRMNMKVRQIRAHQAVEADRGRLAVERGPIVYCAEGVDNGEMVLNKTIPEGANFTESTFMIGNATFPMLTAKGMAVYRGVHSKKESAATLKLVPYFAWCHRGAGEMQTWFPTAPEKIDGASLFKTQVSYFFKLDHISALSDGILPKNSGDPDIPRFTFWEHKGTAEWAQYTFPEAEKIQETSVYWFDDEPRGECRLPALWKIKYKESADGEWKEAQASAYPVAKDQLCTVRFALPVRAKIIRLDVQLKKGFSAGILEWRVK